MSVPRSVSRIGRSLLIAVGSLSSMTAAQHGGPLVDFGVVSVTPDDTTTDNVLAGTGGYAQIFFVKNIGTQTYTFTISCFGRVNVTCTGTDLSSVTLGPGVSIDIQANYSVGAVGTGRLVLKAPTGGVLDTGYYWLRSEIVGGPGRLPAG